MVAAGWLTSQMRRSSPCPMDISTMSNSAEIARSIPFSMVFPLELSAVAPWATSYGTTVVTQPRSPQRGEEARHMIPQDPGETDREEDATPERQRQELAEVEQDAGRRDQLEDHQRNHESAHLAEPTGGADAAQHTGEDRDEEIALAVSGVGRVEPRHHDEAGRRRHQRRQPVNPQQCGTRIDAREPHRLLIRPHQRRGDAERRAREEQA